MCKFKFPLVTILVILVSLSFLTACQTKYPEEKMTAEEVINKVYVYGIPNIFPVGKSPHPSGQWGAVYEGEGKWRVQGTVTVDIKVEWTSQLREKGLPTTRPWPEYVTDYYQTTWTYANNKIILVKYER